MKPILLSAILIHLCVTSTARANVVFMLEPTTFSVSGTGSMNVYIRAESGTEEIASIDFEFLTSPDPLTNLWFFEPPPESFLDDPNYVFAGNSQAKNGGMTATEVDQNIRIHFEDATANGQNITLTDTTPLLVASLRLQHIGDSPETFFVESDGWVRKADNTPVPYSRNFGRVDVVAVPEPSSVLSCSVFALLLLARRRRMATV